MKLDLQFIGKADPLAELYEAVGQASFVVQDSELAPGCAPALVVPGIGDLVLLRMHPGPDIRAFRCTGRQFDFSEVGSPILRLQLDMP